jgi:hypothetical protein
MHDNPIHTFFQVLGGNIPDQLTLGGYRWIEVALYWVLPIGSLAIAYTNWRLDATQHTDTHLGIYAMRLVSAGMWYLGTLWRLPVPVAGGFKFLLENTVKYSSFQKHASIVQVFRDHIAQVQPLVFLLETALAVSLMLGIALRLHVLAHCVRIATSIVKRHDRTDEHDGPFQQEFDCTPWRLTSRSRGIIAAAIESSLRGTLSRQPVSGHEKPAPNGFQCVVLACHRHGAQGYQ